MLYTSFSLEYVVYNLKQMLINLKLNKEVISQAIPQNPKTPNV